MPPSSPSRQALIGEVCTAENPAAAISAIEREIVLKSQQNACRIAPSATFSASMNFPSFACCVLPPLCEFAQPAKAAAVPVSISAVSEEAIILLYNYNHHLSFNLSSVKADTK